MPRNSLTKNGNLEKKLPYFSVEFKSPVGRILIFLVNSSQNVQFAPYKHFILRLINKSCSHILTENLLFLYVVCFRCVGVGHEV
jgi:hypothetical protein